MLLQIVLVYPGLCNMMHACTADGGKWGKWSGPDAGHPHPWCNITSQCVDGRNLALAVYVTFDIILDHP